MDLIEKLNELDTQLFIWLNGMHYDWLDPVMFYATKTWVWIPFYLFLIGISIYYFRKKALIYVIGAILSVGAADFATSSIMKPGFKRLRPSHNTELKSEVHLVNGYRGGRYGLASSHAANTFAVALFFFLSFRNKSRLFSLLFVWALFVSYTRIYLGVHYPGDIILGAITGMAMAVLFFFLSKAFLRRLENK